LPRKIPAGSSPDALRLSGLDPAGIFLGKAAAIAAQLVAVEAVLAVGVVVMYGTEVTGVPLLVATIGAATAGLAAAGTLYGVLAAGLRVKETLLPILLLPVLSPVLIGATKAFEAALGGVAADGWPWLGLLVVFALLYLTFGTLAFGTLLEES
jgi:heme exporter protein B